MTEESDLVKEFKNVFEEEDKKKEKENSAIFVKSFLEAFNAAKEMKIKESNDFTAITNWIDGYIDKSKNSLNNKREQARLLGGALGGFMGFIEYVLPNPKYKEYMKGYVKRNILNKAETISEDLKESGKKIKLKFIKNRIQKIAKRYGGQLDEGMQILLAQIAEKFA